MRTCEICGKTNIPNKSFGGHKSGHSRQGNVYPHLRTGTNKVYPGCGITFYAERRRREYCSRKCRNATFRKKIEESIVDNSGITRGELTRLKNTIHNCMICGRKETAITNKTQKSPSRLAYDHDHKTNSFRGLLCMQCNRNLGWYDKYSTEVEEYLSIKYSKEDSIENQVKQLLN